jgi:hypothetical protein
MLLLPLDFGLWTLGLAFGGFTLWPSKSRGPGNSWPKNWTLDLTFGSFTLHLTIDYLFSAHFFRLSTKFGHSIPRPLNLDCHSVKRPKVNDRSLPSHCRPRLLFVLGKLNKFWEKPDFRGCPSTEWRMNVVMNVQKLLIRVIVRIGMDPSSSITSVQHNRMCNICTPTSWFGADLSHIPYWSY